MTHDPEIEKGLRFAQEKFLSAAELAVLLNLMDMENELQPLMQQKLIERIGWPQQKVNKNVILLRAKGIIANVQNRGELRFC